MAQIFVNDVKLRLVFEAGLGNEGMPILKNKTFNRVRLTVTPEELYNTAAAIASLSDYALFEVNRLEKAAVAQ
ncbi:DUF1659 domain-containing protein [Jeotgalibacillus soli]|uniref:DUF1659 domain-containing protein n=1 Tax=Jeotgalibacillus soli TaxID=889306 RepID=A0A0C2VKU5_9BACL|nr:DUF1659 domain-containing protein [Jeotgalibacillus soli]KIL45061.1 hypothetical protein KP78_26050 [Jeotgalibacillus soli]